VKAMQTNLLDHPKLKVRLRTGSEGPRHDPYSYTELTVVQPHGTTVLHNGLGVWLKSDDHDVKPPSYLGHDEQEAWLRDTGFRTLTNYTVEQLERMARKLKSRCKCGGKSFHSECGYPGETFDVCDSCGDIHDSFFCIEVVM